nr:unnamed protein product [Digitaria exilis]CAB3505120.1 unnamed protein product [Digitaria exilis]
MSQETTDGHLMAIRIEFFNGDHRAAGGSSGKPDDALVDAPKAALAHLEQAAEVAGGGPELSAPLSSYSSGMLRADETETEPDDLLAAAARAAALESSDRLERAPVEGNEAAAGDAGASAPSRLFSPLPFLTLLGKRRNRKQPMAWRKKRGGGAQLSSRWILASASPSPPQSSNRDGNERQDELLETKADQRQGNKVLGVKTFSVDCSTAQRAKNCVERQHEPCRVGTTLKDWCRLV